MADDAFETVDMNHPLDEPAATTADEAVVLESSSWLGSVDDADPPESELEVVLSEPAWIDADLDDHGAVPVTFEAAAAQDDRRAIPAPSGWSDPATGNDGPAYWDRILSSEHARVRRYKHPATVVFVEVDGIEQVAATWGRDAAMRILTNIGRALAREARSSDSSARIEPGRFGVLLTETDEIAAINFVERARGACEARLGLTDGLRIGIGWASLGPPDLGESLETATARLDADLANPA